jgi:hypothetical protein
MSERRERSGEVDAMRSSTGEQIAAVRATTSALRQLRDGIWTTEEELTGN